ncbi:MAG: FAD-dependent monooxygenase [Treponema sp.]|jgi:flavin-dependent dehydrogenase|nr:FAD-dependent monooxygenase [Treponema sp.]
MKRQVIVVGAGPSGSSAAFYCAKRGLDVLLVDKEPWPRDKVCGDGWLPSLKPFFQDMGIYEEMKSLNTVSGANEFILASPNEQVVTFSLGSHGDGDGMFIIQRRIGDDVVRRAAVRGGAEFLDNFDVTDLVIHRGKVSGIRGYLRNQPIEMEADAVIIANGSHSMLARRLGIFNEDPSLSMFAARGYFTNLPPELKPGTVLQFYLPEGIPNYHKARKSMSFGWISAHDKPGCGTLGLVIPIETIEALEMSLEEVFNWFVNHSKNGQRFFKGAKLADELKGWRLLGCTEVQKNYVQGALLIGDACSQAECAHFYGIPAGMMSGKIAAAVLDDIFATGDDSEAAFARFHTIVSEKLNHQYKFYQQFRQMVHFDIENVNKMNEFAVKNFEGVPEYSIVMYRFVTEVLGKTIPHPPAAAERLSQ